MRNGIERFYFGRRMLNMNDSVIMPKDLSGNETEPLTSEYTPVPITVSAEQIKKSLSYEQPGPSEIS